jgi:hypothetical protein
MYNIYFSQHRLERLSQERGARDRPSYPQNGIIVISYIYRTSAGGPGLTRMRINTVKHDLSCILNEHITAQRTVNIAAHTVTCTALTIIADILLWLTSQPSFSLAITFLYSELLNILIKGKLTVQVTSKGSMHLRQPLGELWIWLQVWVACPISPPPPLPRSPFSSTGASGDRKGGRTTAGHFPAHMLWRGFPTALIHHIWHGCCHIYMGHPSPQRERPSKRIGAGVQCFQVATGVGEGEGWPMREEVLTGGGGEGVGTNVYKWSR